MFWGWWTVTIFKPTAIFFLVTFVKNNIYNTYLISGLPPTPISTISQSSLEAVILGMQNDYLYFVAKGDGTHKFSKTYKEHLDAVKKYQLN